MSARKSKLDQLKVANPCSASWEHMTGNAQKRFCSECSKHVFDFSRMTRQQIEAVTALNQGNLCARITRREDGSMVMAEPRLPAYPGRRLNLPVLSVAVVAAQAPPMAEDIVLTLAELVDDEAVQDAADEYTDGIEYDDSETQPDKETTNSKAQPKTVAAQIAISKRSIKLTSFLAVVNQRLNH